MAVMIFVEGKAKTFKRPKLGESMMLVGPLNSEQFQEVCAQLQSPIIEVTF